MALLDDASSHEVMRLLSLFPVERLRQEFGAGSKEEICTREANTANANNLRRIEGFVCRHFGSCRQHVYVFECDPEFELPQAIRNGNAISQIDSTAFYLVRAEFTIIIPAPLSQETLTLLWPVKVTTIGSNCVVQFVKLEKDVGAMFGDNARVLQKIVTEADILGDVAGGLAVADLNRGIKNLWVQDFHECYLGRYKRAHSTSTEMMDEKRGIKQHMRGLYDEMMTCPIHSSAFTVLDRAIKLDTYSVNPTEGILGFPKYSDSGASDAIIRRVIENNR